jgi:hypothetical protein
MAAAGGIGGAILSFWMQTFAESSFAYGMTAQQAFEFYLEMGGPNDVTRFYNAYRSVVNASDAAALLAGLGLDILPDATTFPRALTRLTRNYSFIVGLAGNDPFTGEDIIRYVTVSSDRLLRIGEIYQAAYATVTGEETSHTINVRSARLHSVLRAGEQGTL